MTCSGVRQRWIKHAKLISSCYPTTPEETGPKKNELALLLYYASSRPAKLTKCGSYLEKRVAADVRKRKKQDTEVSLAIIEALLNDCNRDINFFSQNILQIIDDCSRSDDIDLVSRATSLFITFCKYHDGSTLGIDIEFTSLYECLIDRFARFSVYKHDTNSNLEQRYRSFGLRATQGVATSKALYGSDSEQQLKSIIPAILHNLIDADIGLEDMKKNDSNSLVEEGSTAQSHRFSLDVEDVSKEENTRLAFHSLKQVFKSSDQANAAWSVKPTLDFLGENNLWWPNSFGTTLVSLILSILQAKDRSILVKYIIQQLESTCEDSNSATAKQVTLIEMLSFILTSDLNLDNLSTGDVLKDLLELSLKFLKMNAGEKHSIEKLEEKMSDENENLNSKILNGLIKSIGGLATHIYYGTQVKDIMDRIIQFMKLNSISDTSPQYNSEQNSFDEVSPTEARLMLIRCLDMVIETNREAVQRFPNISRNQVPIEVFQDTVVLCLDPDLELRIAYSNVLTKFLEYNQSEEIKENPITHEVPSLHFLNSLHLSLYQYALSPSAQPSDHVAISKILRSLLSYFKYDQIIIGVPVLFKLQSDVKEEKLEDFARQRSMASVIVRYFYDISKILGIAELRQYIEDVIQERTKKCQLSRYIQLSYSPNDITPLLNINIFTSFDDEMNDNNNNNNNGPFQPVDVWLDRQYIVSILCQHPELKKAAGSDLEYRLTAEWKPEEGFEQVKKQAQLIRVSQYMGSTKPLNTPIIMTFEDNSTEFQKPIIKVEQLRDALVAQPINDSSEHDTSDLESMVSLGTGPSSKKSKKPKSKEVKAFLSTIDAKSASTSSLVNPPYRTSFITE